MIPVFEPCYGEEEIAAVVDALRKGEISGSFGSYIPEFEQTFARYVGCAFGIAVSSGTTALQLAVAAANIGRGDDVLVSSSTNIATALAVTHNGAIPVPIDAESETWNLDLDLIESGIRPSTRAIIPVHLYGHPVYMPRLMNLAAKHGLVVIEDCAESHGATCEGRMTGSFGTMGCFSFYANKVITTGEGGMVVTNDPVLAERLRLLRNLAFTEPRFRHESLGYNFRMTGYQAAMGVAQMKKIDAIIDRKRVVARLYHDHLRDIPWLQLPLEKPWARHVYWMYALVLRDDALVSRTALMKSLKNAGIDTRTFFCPMNQQPGLLKTEGFRATACPVADRLWEKGLYLPSSITLTEDQIAFIAESIRRAA